ncbi:patatin-like phospholipase family protein [Bernardetia sp. MNP-M8]|uniref:patatin-like phospholipase family protein n=1 Tax=Bernardetia sp. MNP-M8 TaxID=3127470 RepID=UPI0030D43A75
MTAEDFTQHDIITNLIKQLKKKGVHRKIFSDVLDDEGHQYVDLVQEGGGVLGIALIGYVHVLEQMGIRFLGYAGTSVGAINTIYMASLGDRTKLKTDKMIELIANKNFIDFIDGDENAREFAIAISENNGEIHWSKLIWRGVKAFSKLWEDWGLNPGTHFYYWFTEALGKEGIYTSKHLEKAVADLPKSLRIRQGVNHTIEGVKASISIIATDITTESKVIFPAMRSLYWKNSHLINPTNFVRASMSIPFFFTPFKVTDIPNGKKAQENWKSRVAYRGDIPKEVFFVDGGIISNFPADVFHKSHVPRLPSFGVKLGTERHRPNDISNPFIFTRAIVESMRQIADYNFILRNPDYRQLITWIDIGSHNWIDFTLSDDDKLDLFVRGAKAAAYFLKTFDWQKYKDTRAAQSPYTILPPKDDFSIPS